jgi:putative tryptophan/tyrosine transport system substrate-binding protein
MRLSAIGLLITLALSLLVAPLSSDTHAVAKVVQIGILANEPSPAIEALRSALHALGYIEGQNMVFVSRWAQGRPEQFPALAAEIVRLQVDVIVTWATPATQAAKDATSTIPIVMGATGAPVEAGLVASLAQPGGNITGLTSIAADLEEKRLAFFKEAAPAVTRVALLWNPSNAFSVLTLKRTQAAAQALGVHLHPVEVQSANDFEHAFAAITREYAEALIVHPDPLILYHRTQIADFTTKSRLPSMHGYRDHVEAGGLMAYTPDYSDLFRRAAVYVDKILKGAKPGDLPVEQAMKFILIINLNTAKALGLTLPPTLLFQADEVIR